MKKKKIGKNNNNTLFIEIIESLRNTAAGTKAWKARKQQKKQRGWPAQLALANFYFYAQSESYIMLCQCKLYY